MGIDFNNIRTDHGGPRNGFEELVCQLARRENQPNRSRFRRVEGAGGDGGVEAYWLLPDGSEVGYQAKYFLKSANVDWGQIDRSVKAAIDNHPKLKRYVIALPCDLTDRAGGKQGGWQKWEEWVQRSPAASNIEFELWAAHELRDRLMQPASAGLRAYWFGEIDLSPTWFDTQLKNAIGNLDDRFHPEDHVDVGVSRLFLTLCRSDVVIQQANKLLDVVAEKNGLDFALTDAGNDEAPLTECIRSVERLLDLSKEQSPDLAEPWGLDRWQALADQCVSDINQLLSWSWSAENEINKAGTRAPPAGYYTNSNTP